MKNLNELNKNINAVSETRQITNAMYLLSATEAKKIMPTVDYSRNYMIKLKSTVKSILTHLDGIKHPYLEKQSDGKCAVIIIASDKGLCGSYNFNVLKKATKILDSKEKPFVCVMGGFVKRALEGKGYSVSMEWIGPSQHPTMHYARQIAECFSDMFKLGQIKELYIVYTKYSMSSPTPEVLQLLPLELSSFDGIKLENNDNYELLCEPEAEKAIEHIVEQYLIGALYSCLQQSVASEHICRMTAMQTATDNADEMLNKLNAEFSLVRQTQITNEISEAIADRL